MNFWHKLASKEGAMKEGIVAFMLGAGIGIGMLCCPKVRQFMDKMQNKVENKIEKIKKKAQNKLKS